MKESLAVETDIAHMLLAACPSDCSDSGPSGDSQSPEFGHVLQATEATVAVPHKAVRAALGVARRLSFSDC